MRAKVKDEDHDDEEREVLARSRVEDGALAGDLFSRTHRSSRELRFVSSMLIVAPASRCVPIPRSREALREDAYFVQFFFILSLDDDAPPSSPPLDALTPATRKLGLHSISATKRNILEFRVSLQVHGRSRSCALSALGSLMSVMQRASQPIR